MGGGGEQQRALRWRKGAWGVPFNLVLGPVRNTRTHTRPCKELRGRTATLPQHDRGRAARRPSRSAVSSLAATAGRRAGPAIQVTAGAAGARTFHSLTGCGGCAEGGSGFLLFRPPARSLGPGQSPVFANGLLQVGPCQVCQALAN